MVEIYGPGVDKIIRENEKIGFMVNFMDVYKNKIIDNNIQLSKTSFSFDEFKKYKIYFNDLLITPSSENKEEIGITSIIKFNYNAVYSYHLNLIRCSDTCFPDFLNIHFETNAIRKYFYAISQGVSRYTLKKSDFLNLQILYPSLPEQQKIAHFFTLLDKRIELVENKLKLYELKKKYFLNKLFCKNMLKFDLSIYIQKSKTDFIGTSSIYHAKISNTNGFIIKNKIDIPKHKNNFQIVNPENFVYNPSRINVGSIVLNESEKMCAVSPMYVVFSTKNIDISILKYYFQTHVFRYYVKKFSFGSVRNSLNFDEMKRIPFFQKIPNNIATFLSILKKIDLLIDDMKKYKKNILKMKNFYLEKIFV